MRLAWRLVRGKGKKPLAFELPGQHLVALYAPKAQAVLAQLKVDAKINEHQAALHLLGLVSVKGRIVTGDAA